jgi:mannan endo-1,4-beta-mannosidase
LGYAFVFHVVYYKSIYLYYYQQGANYIAAHQNWQCDRAKTIKSVLGSNSGVSPNFPHIYIRHYVYTNKLVMTYITILITTGGESWLDESMQPDWFNCAELDVIAIHGYGVGDFDTNKIAGYVKKAESAGKKLIFQEWGM